jgi:hypothetical protein
MLTPEEHHLKEKIKHSKRLADKNRFDHVQRTTRLRRLFARVRDHVKSVFRK